MRLQATYIQSFNNGTTTIGQDYTFSFKEISKKKPHHKLLVRPSLVISNAVTSSSLTNLVMISPEFQSKSGNQFNTTGNQGKFILATNHSSSGLFNQQPSGSFLMSDLPIVPFTISMEQFDGTPIVTPDTITFNIIFTIMEVDCDIERPVNHKVVSSYIRTMNFGTTAAAAYVFKSKSFTGLFKKKPSNKWLIFNAMTNQSLSSGSGRFLFMTHPALTGKSRTIQIPSPPTTETLSNNYYLGMNTAASGTALAQSQMNDYIIVDDLSNPAFEIMVGQSVSISGSWDWDTTLNIFEVEYN